MLLRSVVLSGFLAVAVTPGWSETTVAPPVAQAAIAPHVAALSEALMMGDVVVILRDEGADYGMTLQEEMFPGKGGVQWAAQVTQIYDVAAMRARFDQTLQAELGNDAALAAKAQAFFASQTGKKALTLELEARRAMMDDAVKDAAQTTVDDMRARSDPRLAALESFAKTNDLIEQNVAGALNANLAFYRGLSTAGGFGDQMPEDQMLSDVWQQEPEVRKETEDWLYQFLALSYQGLSDAELAEYQTFSETPEGKRVNAALFAAFNAVFTVISHDLGRAAGKMMQGDDI